MLSYQGAFDKAANVLEEASTLAHRSKPPSLVRLPAGERTARGQERQMRGHPPFVAQGLLTALEALAKTDEAARER
jgi:hypothetical protein